MNRSTVPVSNVVGEEGDRLVAEVAIEKLHASPRAVPPRRQRNIDVRTREYLTPDEVDRLMDAAKRTGRHGHRDSTLIMIAYRHGLRVSELVAMRWDQLDMKAGTFHVARLKNGSPSVHPIRGPELRALRRLQRDYTRSPYVFVTERGGPMTDSNERKMITRAGQKANLPFPVRPLSALVLRSTFGCARQAIWVRGDTMMSRAVRYTELRLR